MQQLRLVQWGQSNLRAIALPMYRGSLYTGPLLSGLHVHKERQQYRPIFSARSARPYVPRRRRGGCLARRARQREREKEKERKKRKRKERKDSNPGSKAVHLRPILSPAILFHPGGAALCPSSDGTLPTQQAPSGRECGPHSDHPPPRGPR